MRGSRSDGARTLEITKELLVRRLQRGVSDVLLGKGKPGCVCLCRGIIRAREILSLRDVGGATAGFILIGLISAGSDGVSSRGQVRLRDI